MSELWIRTDEAEDVAGSIRHVLVCLKLAKKDDSVWKWVILALHGALQGACVCHLTTTAQPIGAVTSKNANQWMTYFEESRGNAQAKQPITQLMNMPDLLKAIRKSNSCGAGWIETGIEISNDELKILNHLHNEFRNQFLHFSPTGWSYEVSGVPNYAHLISRIIEDIFNCGWAFRSLNDEQRENFSKDLRLLTNVKLR